MIGSFATKLGPTGGLILAIGAMTALAIERIHESYKIISQINDQTKQSLEDTKKTADSISSYLSGKKPITKIV